MAKWKTIIKAASKKLRLVPHKQLKENLSWAADDMADAYRLGAEEAQATIVGRLRDLEACEKGGA